MSGVLQFDYHPGNILVPMPIYVLENVKVLGLHDVIRLVGYHLVLCLLVLRRSQEFEWSRYGGSNPACLEYEIKMEQVFDVPPQRANKSSAMGPGTIVDVPSHEI